jgi:hypothetical protein
MVEDGAPREREPAVMASGAAAIPEWPLRPWLLAGLLGVAGLLIHLVTEGRDDVPWQVAAAAFLFFAAIAAAFTLEERRWKEPAGFALAVGAVMAGLAWRAIRYGDSLPDEEYGLAAGVVATALALPLFQAGFHRRRLATPYREVYHHVWTDAISAAGALAFTGLSWLVLLILSELFHLLKIDLLRDAMREGWFGWTFSGIAFGAALGTIRNQAKVLATMQTVVLLVLSILAVPLAAALVLFLLATAVSGPQVLWEATRSATPVLLMCAAGAWVLASVIVRDGDEAMSRSRLLGLAAWVLAAVILPLAVFAAVSMGLRLNQHGLSPERLWGLVAILVALAFGLWFWVALVRGRKAGWAAKLRQANFHLGLFVCGLALVLALPVLDFGAISARNQVARLQSGAVPVEEFDFTALRWDFGDPGRRALQRLARSGDADIADLAEAALAQAERVYRYDGPLRTDDDFDLRVQPEDAELRRLVLDHLRGNPWQCQDHCVALDLGSVADGSRRVAIVQGAGYQVFLLKPGQAGVTPPEVAPAAIPLQEDSIVEIRELPARYIFVDGKPLSKALDEPTAALEGPPPPR